MTWPERGVEVPIRDSPPIRQVPKDRHRLVGVMPYFRQLMRRSDGEKCVDRKDFVPSPELIGLMPVGVPINQRDDDQPLDQLISDLPVGDS